MTHVGARMEAVGDLDGAHPRVSGQGVSVGLHCHAAIGHVPSASTIRLLAGGTLEPTLHTCTHMGDRYHTCTVKPHV